jgi:hypothetical protein
VSLLLRKISSHYNSNRLCEAGKENPFSISPSLQKIQRKKTMDIKQSKQIQGKELDIIITIFQYYKKDEKIAVFQPTGFSKEYA